MAGFNFSVYGGLGRLRVRNDGGGGGVNYIYDGMRVIQERDANNRPQVSYTRGADLSGTLEGAGGIGGLLARTHDYAGCTSQLTVRITNAAPCTLRFWVYHSDTPVEFYTEDGITWPVLDDAEVYADYWEVGPNDYRDCTFEAPGGRTYSIYGFGDYENVQGFWDDFAATLEQHTLEVHSDRDGNSHSFESGIVMCGGDLTGSWLTHTYYHADGNGNVTCLMSANEALVASYRYDPYGNTLAKSGALADANTYRFSSKEIHPATGLYYYGYRFYDPSLQRWINRDPIHEFGFLELKGRKLGFHVGSELNLYTFVGNNPISYIDVAGLKKRFGGLTGGKCCNSSDKDQYWLDGDTHKWTKLPPGKCTGSWDDCDGMTCGGGFYYVQDLEGRNCKTPGKDCDKYAPRRWTPDKQGPDAKSPKDRGAPDNNPPPGYGWGIN